MYECDVAALEVQGIPPPFGALGLTNSVVRYADAVQKLKKLGILFVFFVSFCLAFLFFSKDA